MNELPTILYFAWIALSPFLLIILVNRQPSSGIQNFLVVIYLITIIAGVFIFYELLDLRKNENLTSFYRRKKEAKRFEEEQKQNQMNLLSTARAPFLCCRCGQKPGKNDWNLILGDRSLLDRFSGILQWLQLPLKSKQQNVIMKLKMCDACYKELSTVERILTILQPLIVITSMIIGIIYGIKFSQVFLYIVLFFILGWVFNALIEFVVSGIINREFYKIDTKYRYVRFSNRDFQNEFGKINPNFVSKT